MHFRSGTRVLAILVAATLILLLIGAYLSLPRAFILLSTTTSTRDTGLLSYLLPKFAEETGIEVRYVAVGTGQALDAGRRGDADVVIVHAPGLEDAFMAEGNGLCRNEVMYNQFVIVGPSEDPAGVRSAANATDALLRIYNTTSRFESRGDNSGTHVKELALWSALGLSASTFGAWYEETDQGMGATLTISDQRDAYTLSDDGTWYAREASLPNLSLVYDQPDPVLRNRYSVIPVSPAAHPHVKSAHSLEFARWLGGTRGQSLIAAYSIAGHLIFTPNYDPNAAGVC